MITLECSYQKKVGLPQYSSHQFSVTLSTEIADLANVQTESARVYALLQQSVDSSLQQPGFLPSPTLSQGNGNGRNESWACSQKQRDLILKLVDEHKLEKTAVEQLAQDRFGKTVKSLNKLEASGLIDALIEQTGGNTGNRRRHFDGSRNPTHAR